jgi:hypothetical protein
MPPAHAIRAFLVLVFATLTVFSFFPGFVKAAHPLEALAARGGGSAPADLPVAQTNGLGAGAYSVAVGDFNGDGKTDVALTNNGDPGEVAWQRRRNVSIAPPV